jgi:hypothetical protein
MSTMTAIFIGLIVLGGMGFLLFRHIKGIRSMQSEAKRAFQARLLAPDWAMYAEHLQREVPEAMKLLYAEFALLLSEVEIPLESGITITEFFPLDAQALIDQKAFQPENMGFDCLPFATMNGPELFLRPGSDAVNSVYLFNGDAIEVVFADVADLLNDLRSHSEAISRLKSPD